MPWARKRPKVRLHMMDEKPSIEGFLIGRASGHYILARAELMESPDRTFELAGEIRVPASRVFFLQVMP